MIRKGFYTVDAGDNVATALWDMDAGTGDVFGAVSGKIEITEKIECGFKIALRPIKKGGEVYKYGVCIGRAKCEISRGELVHSHNLESLCDSRSGSFNEKTAVPEDIRYFLRETEV